MNVGFLTTIWNSGSSFYRLELPALCLENAGWNCEILNDYLVAPSGELLGVSWNSDGKTQTVIDGIDIFVTQRWMNDNAVEVTRAAQATGQKFISDVDDHYWEIPPDNVALYATDPKYFPSYNRDRYLDQLETSDAIICSTPELQQYFEKFDVPTYLHRNMINLDMWRVHDVTKTRWKPRIGWTGSTRWRQEDLMETRAAVGTFVNDNKLDFAHVGHRTDGPSAAELLGIDSKRVKVQFPQVEFNGYASSVIRSRMDIGIVPMVESPFNRAKSCLKGMEFAACGVPFVASPLPEYERLGVGMLAKSPKDWKNALERLLDPEWRADLAHESHEWVKLEDYRVRGIEYVNMFNELIKG